VDAEIEGLHTIIKTVSILAGNEDWEGIDRYIATQNWDGLTILHTLGLLRSSFPIRSKLANWIPLRDHGMARFENRLSAFHGLVDK
jgi:hypothetical protein